MKFRIDLAGKQFGRWKVISFDSIINHASYWNCKCDCGVEKIIMGGNLAGGKSKSCGCLARELTSAANSTHGLTRTPSYIVWMLMKQRCLNPKSTSYKRYGGRGITVCDAWLSFDRFFADMGVRPERKTLERKHNNGNYEPNNCVWATRTEQARNRRSSKLITYQGETQCLAEFAERFNIHQETLRKRLLSGWSVDDALTKPTKRGLSYA